MMRKAKRLVSWGVECVWLIEPEKECAVIVSQENPQMVWADRDLHIPGAEIRLPFADVLAP